MGEIKQQVEMKIDFQNYQRLISWAWRPNK